MPTPSIALPGLTKASQRAFIRRLRKGTWEEERTPSKARRCPTRKQVAEWQKLAEENFGVTRNEDGEVSSLSMTLRYVAEFCRLNGLKTEEG